MSALTVDACSLKESIVNKEPGGRRMDGSCISNKRTLLDVYDEVAAQINKRDVGIQLNIL